MDMPEDQIQAVVEVLEENETHLSDGYGYYCGPSVSEALRKIAIAIIIRLDMVRK